MKRGSADAAIGLDPEASGLDGVLNMAHRKKCGAYERADRSLADGEFTGAVS
jgi:hypothetical protein